MVVIHNYLNNSFHTYFLQTTFVDKRKNISIPKDIE